MVKFFSFENNAWIQYASLINSINQVESDFQSLSQASLKEKVQKLRSSCFASQTKLDSKTLVESFGLVREASRRTLGLRHYNTQLLGGFVLNDQKIAEMRTGEGKTLVATAPAFANALSKKGVHIVTANEYLAQRDAEWMGQIYRYLGLNVGLVHSQMESFQRRKNYKRDITYTTNSEVGFDFLRDNLVTQKKDLVQRPYHFCIVDEVDSILIDEARTPLIISQQASVDLEKILKAREIVKFFVEFRDYIVDQKAKEVSLTALGFKKTQRLLNVQNIYSLREPWIPFVLNALKAKILFLKDVHYILKDNEIIIVDEFTGRILEGRKWAEGLHNAIEAKEGIYGLEGNETIASITYQNLFRLYPKLAGMTGTAKTEELEFETIYNLKVSILPTYKPIRRTDLPDAIYIDELSKWKAVAMECKRFHTLQRPILVGTTTIQNSETLSFLLKDYKVSHQLLNAKPENIKQESEIIAQAGCLGALTIATNMAGRGTDVLLGGNPEFKASRQTSWILEKIIDKGLLSEVEEIQEFLPFLKRNRTKLLNFQNHFESLLNVIKMPNKSLNVFEQLILALYKKLFFKYQLECKKEKEKVLSLGGLYVIGTERHESRRIDNQLRGRAGRQGDPGSSRFFLSLNDPLLKTFGGENIKAFMKVFQIQEDALEASFLSKTLTRAQQKVEGFYYDQRKTLNKYDGVLDKHRSIVYRFRKEVLLSSSVRDLILELGEGFVEDFFEPNEKEEKTFVKPRFLYSFDSLFKLSFDKMSQLTFDEMEEAKALVYEQFWALYANIEVGFWFYDFEVFRRYERLLVLKYIDVYWSQHLENMKFLKEAVSWEAYAQKDPFLQYEEQANTSFQKTLKECRNIIIHEILGSEIL